jgi:putative phosphoribosyl transferase
VFGPPSEALFADRKEAGELLAASLDPVPWKDVVILAIPRGGVEVGAAVADALGASLDVVIPRKIGAPGNPELGLGAVAGHVEVLDRDLIERLGVGEEYLRDEIEAQRREATRREDAYRGDRPAAELSGRVAVVVDDGIATGGTATAALRLARSQGATRVVLAVPVGPSQAMARLREEADEIRILRTPEPFYAVGQWYLDFPQVTDERVIELLSARPPGRS